MKQIPLGKIRVDENFYWTIDMIERLSQVKFIVHPAIKRLADERRNLERERKQLLDSL